MFNLNLNKKIKKYNQGISGLELLKTVDKNLQKECIAVEVNDKIKDLSFVVNNSCKIKFILSSSLKGIDIIRRDAAYILAQAVKELFPNAKLAIGFIIKNGFFYDFANVEPFNNVDLKKIEHRMRKIVNLKLTIRKKFFTKKEAINFFQNQGEEYKVEIINSFSKDKKISIYTHGNFSDLCKGPRAFNTSFVKVFKLMKVSGVYWKGNSKYEMLQRIYGTAWSSKEELNQYIKMLEEAEKRDHRKIGKQSNLFHLQEEAQGSIFWHPKGWNLFQRLTSYIRNKHTNNGYFEISTPEIMNKSLWESSGHWSKFRTNMFIAQSAYKNKTYVIRPMNCPGSVQIYSRGIKSYKNLPLRLAEFGKVFRFESSGTLCGLMRARIFTQDDAHIFCSKKQINYECINVCKLIKNIYKEFGFINVKVRFSDRPNKRMGSSIMWDKSEIALLNALKHQSIPYILNKREGAFYGPKLEFILRDAIGRDWQLGTLQVDLNLPDRLNIEYIGKDGKNYTPVILHRALFGSIERFLGIVLEHYSGNLPLWLAPTQVIIISITSEVVNYASYVFKILRNNCIRCACDFENEKIHYKIRKHFFVKIPIILILGKNEEDNKLVSIKKLGDKSQQTLELNNFIDKLLYTIKQKKNDYIKKN